VAALLVLDVTEDKMHLPGATQVVPVVNTLTKRYGYRFGVTIFASGSSSPPAKGLEHSPDALMTPRGPDHSWLNPLLQAKGVSTLYLCGLPFEGLVAEMAAEALQIGVAVFVVQDGVVQSNPVMADKRKEELTRLGVSFVDSARL
jgi:nicotinamidase-related amidase